MKWYVKVELILEVESWDLGDNISFVEEFVLDELNEVKIHKDIKIEETSIDALSFTEWEDWRDMYM